MEEAQWKAQIQLGFGKIEGPNQSPKKDEAQSKLDKKEAQ